MSERITETRWDYDSTQIKPMVTGLDNGNCRVPIAEIYGKDVEERDAIGTLIAFGPRLQAGVKDAIRYLCEQDVDFGKRIVAAREVLSDLDYDLEEALTPK